MNLSFSTRGWNHLPWEDQVRDAEEYHFQGIEIYNLTRTPQWTERSSPFHQYHLNERTCVTYYLHTSELSCRGEICCGYCR